MSAVAVEQRGVYVDGAWRRTPDVYDRHNPARPWEVTGRYSAARPADVADAYTAASAAAKNWANQGADDRARALFRAGELIAERADDLGAALTAEEGKALADARHEAAVASEIFKHFAAECSEPAGEVYASRCSQLLYRQRVPLGVVCAITPWNFPLAIPAWRIAPALAYGNAVVWKPAELTPQCAVNLTEILVEAGLPPGMLNVVTGPASWTSEALLAGAGLAGLTFTGSSGDGSLIGSALSGRNVRLQLDAGGGNLAVVLADADIGLAARDIATAGMRQRRERCGGATRVIVERLVADELIERLATAVGALRVGDPAELETDVGPLASRWQFDSVRARLEHVHAAGLEVVAGGRATDPDRGFFVDPTVVVDPDTETALSVDEVVGPLVTITPVDDARAAVAGAADRWTRLSGSLYARSLDRALVFSDGLDVDVIHVSEGFTGAELDGPGGELKASGFVASKRDDAPREFYTRTKTVRVHSLASA